MSFGQPPGGGWGDHQGRDPFGPPPGPGFGPSPGPYQPQAQASGLAITSLVLSLVGWFMCGPVTSIPGAIIGKIEIGKIERGESSPAGMTLAKVGFWISIANIAAYVLFACIYVAMIVVVFGAAAANQPR